MVNLLTFFSGGKGPLFLQTLERRGVQAVLGE